MSNPFLLDRTPSLRAQNPVKRINTADDLIFFSHSKAYFDLKTWILQLSRACLPSPVVKQLDDAIQYTPEVIAVRDVLAALRNLIDRAPPDTGPRRFGNVAFRQWNALVSEEVDDLLEKYIQPLINDSTVELKAYLLESFGSPQRLDYGTGHELSFIAFLGGLWKLGLFKDEWIIVIGIIEPYLELVRKLIKTYTLEPAGSHGVWGLDDHCFIPYVLGSAQFAPALLTSTSPTPIEGSIDTAPEPASITSMATVNEQRSKNFYFAAIGFILDVKKGPFFEHSPYLYNISGIKDGWGKINKGMLKMYDAEVLGKFPVVQHFRFGALWRWEIDERLQGMDQSGSDGKAQKLYTSGDAVSTTILPSTTVSTQTTMPSTRAPWAGQTPLPPVRTQRGQR